MYSSTRRNRGVRVMGGRAAHALRVQLKMQLTSSSAPTSSQVTPGTVAKPSRMALGCTRITA
eukprot:1077527-Prorocentrum_minimum.AAC.1